ncbi:MAG TPA: hypothetical protein PLF50_07580 [Candidatus Cloacimonadota bacterium]|nr:hypothetical protein [Candidatus Cloacimonadota bacterium]
MDKNLWESLGFNRILELIEPAGEAGRHHKQHLLYYKPGREALLRKEYKSLQQLLSALKSDKKLSAALQSELAAVPYLPQTLNALSKRPLLLHECFEVKQFVYYARRLRELCYAHNLQKLYPFPPLDKVFSLLAPDGLNSPAFVLSPAFDAKLAKQTELLQDLQQQKRRMEQQLLEAAQTKLHLQAPRAELVISRLQSKQIQKIKKSGFYYLAEENFANCIFRLKDTPALASVQKKIANLTEKLTETEDNVLQKISKQLARYASVLQKTANSVQILDWDFAKAQFALRYSCCLPNITSQLQINVAKAVNLPLKISLEEQKRRYQSPDLNFTHQVNVLTGPNMGGKTTALQTLGQICLCTAYALPVPAQYAKLCLFDQIWLNQDYGNKENLSSFGREIVSLSSALKKKGRSLFLFDELARGTNPTEGEAILLAVLQYLTQQNALTLAATHFEKPAHLDWVAQYAIKGIDPKALAKLSRQTGSSLEAQLDKLNQLMDYGLVKLSGKTKPPQNAIPIAQALGLPEEIIQLIRL